jgi:hypothetical protein
MRVEGRLVLAEHVPERDDRHDIEHEQRKRGEARREALYSFSKRYSVPSQLPILSRPERKKTRAT